MTIVIPTASRGPVGQAITLQARLVHKDGSGASVTDEGKALQQADFDSITSNLYNLDSATPDTAVSSPSVTISSAISDTLVDDEIWTEDSIGRNFIHSISGSLITLPNLYRVVYTATLSAGLGSETLTWVFNHQAVAVTTATPTRASQDDIRNIMETDLSVSLTPFITVANTLVTKVASCATDRNDPLTANQLRDIEIYLSAHLYTFRDQQYASKKTGDAAATFQGKTDMGLDSSFYGQMAKILDTSGCLDMLEKGTVAQIGWLGKPPSDQIDYVDRD